MHLYADAVIADSTPGMWLATVPALAELTDWLTRPPSDPHTQGPDTGRGARVEGQQPAGPRCSAEDLNPRDGGPLVL